MNAALGWGIALIVLGLLVTFSNLFGFIAGAPLIWIGLVLMGVGIVIGVWSFVAGRDRTGRMTSGRGPLV